jgi:hypothetical protein
VDLWDLVQQGQIEASRAAAESAHDIAPTALEKGQREFRRLEAGDFPLIAGVIAAVLVIALAGLAYGLTRTRGDVS